MLGCHMLIIPVVTFLTSEALKETRKYCSKGAIRLAFTVCIHRKNQNQMSEFSPSFSTCGFRSHLTHLSTAVLSFDSHTVPSKTMKNMKGSKLRRKLRLRKFGMSHAVMSIFVSLQAAARTPQSLY